MDPQIEHCWQQLIRFAEMFAKKKVDSKERTLQFGYNLGRLVVLLMRKGPGIIFEPYPLLSGYDMSMAIFVINKGLPTLILPPNTQIFERAVIDFGFAIGFVQEELEQNHSEWWVPISPLASKEKWDKVVEFIQEKIILQKLERSSAEEFISAFKGNGLLNWTAIQTRITNSYQSMKK